MFGSVVLDLVILLSFTYFMASLIVSAIQEMIATIFRMRARDFETALKTLILSESDKWKHLLENFLMKSTYFQALVRENGKFPHYMSDRHFALAVIEQIGGTDFDSIKQQINSSTHLPDGFKKTLLLMLAKAKAKMEDAYNKPEGIIAHFQTEVEDFYNNAMDRATGFYKRKVRRIIFWLSFIVAVAANVDTLKIANDALKDKDQLKATADMLAQKVQRMHFTDSGGMAKLVFLDSAGKPVKEFTYNTNIDTTAMPGGIDSLKKQIHELNNISDELKTAGIQYGYKDAADFRRQWFGSLSAFVLKLIGVLFTTLALLLGSGYWFDLLNKVVNIRGSGNKPGDKNSEVVRNRSNPV